MACYSYSPTIPPPVLELTIPHATIEKLFLNLGERRWKLRLEQSMTMLADSFISFKPVKPFQTLSPKADHPVGPNG